MRDDPLMTTREAADYLGLSENTLEQWRSLASRSGKWKGPRFHRLESSVRYRRSDLEAYISSSASEVPS